MSVVTMATKVMSPSSYSFEYRLGSSGEFATCSQQANSPYHRATTANTAAVAAAAHLKSTSPSTCSSAFDPDEQAERNKLIQAATNRLRQKRLEIKLQAMMAQIVEMQCQLDIIKLDTSTSLQLLPSSNISETQLSHFEKRLAHHRADVQRIFQSNNNNNNKREESSAPIKPKESKASSTISSLLSNILYSKSNKSVMMREEQQQDSDYSILGGSLHHHQKRRKRRHYHQQHGSMQNNVVGTSSPPVTATTTTTATSCVSPDDNESSPGSAETTSSVCWSSFDRMSDNNSILVQPLHQEVITNARNRHELLVLHSIPSSSIIQAASETSTSAADRNAALDDVIRFLNDMELNTQDDRLVRDIYEILEQEDILSKLPTATSFPAFHLLQKLLDRGMKWIKFAIVMMLAIIINLKKGPKSFL